MKKSTMLMSFILSAILISNTNAFAADDYNKANEENPVILEEKENKNETEGKENPENPENKENPEDKGNPENKENPDGENNPEGKENEATDNKDKTTPEDKKSEVVDDNLLDDGEPIILEDEPAKDKDSSKKKPSSNKKKPAKKSNQKLLKYPKAKVNVKNKKETADLNGIYKINKKLYHFNKGKLTKNKKFTYKGKTYYALKDGSLATGFQRVGNYTHYFKDDGTMSTNLVTDLGKDWYHKQKIMIKINKFESYGGIYAYNKDTGKYDIPIRSFIASTGLNTKIINTKLKKNQTYRWKELMGNCYGQYSSRINGGILFHSVLYRSKNPETLIARSYNNLGKCCSHGCIRLQTSVAKLIYDKVQKDPDVKVNIYQGKSKNPFGKPVIEKISEKAKTDPTDPNIKS